MQMPPMPPMPPEQPTFPHTAINMNEQGLVLTINLAPGLSMVSGLGPDMLDKICQQWKEVRKAQKNHLELVRNVQRTRNE